MAMAEQRRPESPSAEMAASGSEQEAAQKATRAAAKALNASPLAQKAPRRPSAEEMVEYYRRRGLDKQAATEKVVDDLQKALTIAVRRHPARAQQEPARSVSGSLDALAARLAAVEAKVDEKPDLGGVFVAGVAAGGVLHAVPHVLRAISQVGRGVRNAISSKP